MPIYALHNIAEVATTIISNLQLGDTIVLSGSMGAGKTTLIAAICQALQVHDAISSPTYSIINEYQGALNGNTILIAHMDWYRLNDEAQLLDAGVQEYLLNPNYICFVEWSERAPALLPAHTKYLQINLCANGDRDLEIK